MFLEESKDLGQPLNSFHGLKYLWMSFATVGINPPAKGEGVHVIWRYLYFLYATAIILLAGIVLPTTMAANLMFIDSWKEIIGNLSLTITIAVSTFKQAAVLLNRKRLLSANQFLHQLDVRCDAHPQDRKNVLLFIRYSHLIFAVYISFYAFCGYGFGYIGWRNHMLVYNAWFPEIFSNPEKNYLLAFVYQNFAQTFTIVQNCNNDTYPLSYILLMIGHTRALGDRIERMGKNKIASQEENVKELRNCIQDHKNVQNYFECIRPAISTTLFMQFFITGFILCLTAINLIAFNKNFTEKLFSIIYLFIIVIQIFPACMCVNILVEDTSNLTTAMYSCNWIEQSREFRKMLIIFMQRSQKRNVINAGGLAPVTLQTFLAILRFSFSMFTVISQMQLIE